MLDYYKRILLLLLIPFTAYTNSVCAITPKQARLSFFSVGVEQGLSQSTVQAMKQDHIGFMWIGTKDGLNRYDGSSFTVYKHNADETSIQNNDITAIAEISDGNIMVGFKTGALNKYIRESDDFIAVSPETFYDNPIYSLYMDSTGRIWAATENGLYYSEDTGENFELFAAASMIGLEETEQPLRINKIIAGANASIWFASDKGLLYYVPGNMSMQLLRNQLTADRSRDNNFTSVCQLSDGSILLGTKEKGLFLFDPLTMTFSAFAVTDRDTQLPLLEVTDIVQYFDDSIWVGTAEQGIFVIHPATHKAEKYDAGMANIENSSTLSNNRITVLTLARGNRIFIGTFSGGLNMYDSSRISFPQMKKSAEGISSNVIYGFAEGARPDTFWIATENGLEFWDREKNTFTRYTHDPHNTNSINDDICTDLYRDRSGNLWVVTEQGISRYDEKNDLFIRSDIKDEENNSVLVNALLQDSKGNYWYGSQNGLLFYNPDSRTVRTYKNKPGDAFSILANNVRHIFEDSQGNIWLATTEGLSRFSYQKNIFANFKASPDNPNSIGSDRINCFWEDDEAVWMGTTNGGLNRYDKATGTIAIFSFNEDKFNTTVYSILEDSSGLLWLATNQGILAFDKNTGEVSMNFGVKDGIQNYEFMPNAALKTKNNEFFFGGIRGFNYFYPNNIKQSPILGPMVCTGLSINHTPVKDFSRYITTSGNLQLGFRQTRFTVYYTMLDYQLEGGHQYMYKLEGYKDDWIPNRLNHVTFEKLPPGSYRLLVKGAGANGIWNEEPLIVDITVDPPPWRSNFALAAYIFLIIMLLRHIIQRQRKNNLSMEERSHKLSQMVEDKTWELQISIQLLDEKNKKLYFLTMHDDLTGFFNRKRFADVEDDVNKGLYNDKMPFCIIVADVDGLKLANDYLGHVCGDDLLKEVARILRVSLREEDIACRIGGDEFALIIPSCSQEALDAILTRIKAEQEAYNKNPENPLYISMSLGHSFLYAGEEFKTAFEKADKMMYEAKNTNKTAVSKLIMEKINYSKQYLNF